MTSGRERPVLVRVEGALGRITLNRPAKLNALTLEMVERMSRALLEWRDADAVSAVLVDGAGDRGLCAGGDLRASSGASPLDTAPLDTAPLETAFLRAEYRLNELIATYPKPYVAIMDGVVMGGGLGISAHGSHRVVTDRSRIAMPEVRIGLVPDVGMSALLARAPGAIGMLLALTARTIGGADAIVCGFADAYVPAERIDALAAAVVAAAREAAPSPSSGAVDPAIAHALVSLAVQQHALPVPLAPLSVQRNWIDPCFELDSVPEILVSLDVLAASTIDPAVADAAGQAAAEMRRMSPTALVAAHELLRRAATLDSLHTVLEAEFRAMTALAVRPDAAEGVRAVLVDRDEPAWQPATVDAVDRDEVLRLLAEQREPLLFG